MVVKDLPQVALNKMNEIHNQEVEVINRLFEAIEKRDEKEVDRLLKEFIKDVHEHFQYEQTQMEKYNFFAYPIHISEHDMILQQLSRLEKEWEETKDIDMIKNYLENEFLPWIVNHINTMDAVTAGYLANFINE